MSEEYCGVVGHADDCLCDVYITEPSGWVDDAVQDMWMGQEIINMKGYQAEWDDESILDYLSDLVFAKDNWHKAMFDANVTVGETRPALMRKEIRRRLQSSDNPSIIQVIQDMGLDYDGAMDVLFTGRRDMSFQELAEFEKDVLSHTFPTCSALARKYGMTRRSAEALRSYWGVSVVKVERPRTEAEQMIDKLLLERPELKNVVIGKMIADALGKENRPSTDKIRMRRHYLKKCKRL